MFLVLDGGISLPVPDYLKDDPFKRDDDITDYRWKAEKLDRWQRAYTHCLYSLPNNLDEPLHKAINNIGRNMLGVTDELAIALRFLGEMRIAGYITLEVRRQRGADKEERIIQPTKKFLGLKLDLDSCPAEVIVYPRITGKDRLRTAVQVRRGITTARNKQAAKVVADISKEQFKVNKYIYELIKQFPPDAEDGFKGKYMLERTLHTAELLKDQLFRFEYFLCSRGRKYVTTTCGISPQGADWEKALVIPTYGEALTESGLNALLEAAKGYSEMDWSMEEMISHARDPAKHWDQWATADKPYCYMACANLLSKHEEDPTQPLPAFIPMDGRCSGLQHWSALTRSRSITAHLGMEEHEHELDIYEKCAQDWERTLPLAEKQYATRKAAKIPVMTWGYNATRMTSMDHIDKLFGSKTKWCPESKGWVIYKEGMNRGTAGRLGANLYNQIDDTLAELNAAVNWVSDAATLISKAGNADILWPTPDGFTCKQRKLQGEPCQIRATLSDGSDFKLNLLTYKNAIPAHGKHRSAIAPNIIHSLDATHLRMVARELARLGLPMIFIHDSFATHVNHSETLYRIITETFIELYSGNWMMELKGYWEAKYQVTLIDPPKQGSWDPEILLHLKKFFI